MSVCKSDSVKASVCRSVCVTVNKCLCVKACVRVRVCVCACVYHLNRCKTSTTCRGATAHLPMLPNEATEDVVDGFMDAWTCTCIISIVPPLGAYKSQLGATCNLSLLVYTFNVSCDPIYIYILYIYIYIIFHLFNFIVVVVARPVHSTSEFVKISLGKCVCVSVCKTICVQYVVCKSAYV